MTPKALNQSQNIARTDGILDRLRAATADCHQRLEASLNLLRPSFSRTEYVHLLSAFYGFYSPWEAEAWPLLRQTSTMLDERRKTPLLKEDLGFFGIDAAQVERCEALPRLQSAAAALGSLYVMEGATLGGQILFRHFAATLDLDRQGLTFFYGYGPNTAGMWRRFREEVAAFATPANQSAIAESAIATFESMRQWLTRAEAV
jgi:heme oxygenase